MILTSLPRVALVGRTNVGKSTLFNRLARRTQSIVSDQENVTRDFIHEALEWNNKRFELVDTGGLTPTGSDDPFHDDIQAIGHKACQDADILLFLCDGKNGLTTQDRMLAKELHRLDKPVLLVLNKADNKNDIALHESDFYALGFSQHFLISSIHGTGIKELLNHVASLLPRVKDKLPSAPDCKIALLGKPNVGKSSLMNQLLKYERSIVSDKAGTTREALSERVTFYGQDLLFTDTAGIRRKRKVTDDLESLMVKSSLQAVRRAEIIVMLVDGSSGRLSDQELKLMFYAFEQHKALLLVFNKSDLVDDEKKDLLSFELEPYKFFLKNIPQIHTSCLSGKNVGIVMREINKIRDRLTQKIDCAELTEYLHERLRKKPLFHKRQRLQLFSITRRQDKGIAFTLCVNQPEWFGQSQLSYFENILRRKYDLRGMPCTICSD